METTAKYSQDSAVEISMFKYTDIPEKKSLKFVCLFHLTCEQNKCSLCKPKVGVDSRTMLVVLV